MKYSHIFNEFSHESPLRGRENGVDDDILRRGVFFAVTCGGRSPRPCVAERWRRRLQPPPPRLELEVSGSVDRKIRGLARSVGPPPPSEGKNNDNDGLTKRLKCTLASGGKGQGGREEPSCVSEEGSVPTGLVKKKKRQEARPGGHRRTNRTFHWRRQREREKGRKRGAEERTDPKIMGTRFSARSGRTDHAPAWRM